MDALSLPEKLSLVYRFLGLPPYVAARVLWTNVLHKNPYQSARRATFDSMVHYAGGHLTVRQMRAAGKPTRTTFNAFVKAQRLHHSIEPLAHDAALLWIGQKLGGKTLLYFHGGGYVFPISPMHLSFLRYVQEEHERTHGVPLNVAVLEYSLAPTHQFPTQLRQAVSALLHLFKSGVSPDQIIIGGDSAGGNLALALAAHILHPHPEVERIELKVPLAGVLLISPGVSRDVSMRSKDSIHPLSYQRMYASMPLDTSPGAWAGRQALHAPEGWWADLRAVTPRVLITSGEHENMYTCISDFGRRLNAEAKGMQVETLSEAGAPHINPVADLSAMGDGPGKGAQRVAAWLCEV